MMYEANQEIRWREEENSKRMQERAGSQYPMHYLDRLIEELEEMNLEDKDEVPDSFIEKLKVLSAILPEGVPVPRRWPSRPTRLLDLCFDMQSAVLRQIHERQAQEFDDYRDEPEETRLLDGYGVA